jgi:hypothetical protein
VRDFLPPLPGDPETARVLADVLAAQGGSLRSLANTLRRLGDPATTTWESPAGVVFTARAGGVAGVIERVGRRYAVSATAVRGLAAVLQECQAQVAWAQRVNEAAWPDFLAASEAKVVAESSAAPGSAAEAARCQVVMAQAGERAERAERVHAQASARYRDADRRCAAVLGGLLDDGLADRWHYDLLTGTSSTAAQVSQGCDGARWVPGWGAAAKAVGTTADAAQLGSDLVVKVAYGDGSWRSIAVSGAAAALGQSATVLKQGAKATNARAIESARTRVERRALRLTTSRRLQVAAADHVRRGFRDPMPPPKPLALAPPPPGLAARSRWVVAQGQARLRAELDRRWLADFRAVVGTPGASGGMFVSGVALEGTQKVVEVGDALESRFRHERQVSRPVSTGE